MVVNRFVLAALAAVVLSGCLVWGSRCGDGVCDLNEYCNDCPDDCGACPYCGDGVCSGAEDCDNCTEDCVAPACPYCGDGVCNGADDCDNCRDDCESTGCPLDTCGNGECELDDCARCPEECSSGC